MKNCHFEIGMTSLCGTPAVAALAAQDPFNWQPCPDTNDTRVQCGFLKVPLNHLDPSPDQTIDIAVRRFRVPNATKGTILLNPGGPGIPGMPWATGRVAWYLGGQHDVLGFDPRGVGKSRPARCTKNGYTATTEWPKQRHLPFDSPTAETSLGRFGAPLKAIVRRCEMYDGDYVKYLSTSFVARDMDLIRAALNESVVNYYGRSYGTVLGATYVNMFPHRVGRVVFESVLDPTVYTGPSSGMLATSTVDADETFDAFANTCEAAGPANCPLASEPHVGKRIREFLAKTEETPVIAPTAAGDDFTVVMASEIRDKILFDLYKPEKWLGLARYLNDLLRGQYVSDPVRETCPVTNSSYLGMYMEFPIYIANDGDLERAQDWNCALREAKQNSPLFGMQFAFYALPAMYWKIRPVERYSGPWNVQLPQPILILQNKIDPVTPLRGARALARLMGSNAVLVTRDGYGHGINRMRSSCIFNAITAFFNNATYPKHNSNCKVDAGPFDFNPDQASTEKKLDEVDEAE
ncbi:hypothetical protein H257_11309 [Aphanomyces astaci]|nr:hypothetical protein H257_11309 [Aphanomyces astaci]ETV74001.1 hypothetical protein H257_11309 [Aphanomyces astaci]|eukprot:XP_009836514.1 hypothetical protein H257_11309 [Aphanomyces astaci]